MKPSKNDYKNALGFVTRLIDSILIVDFATTKQLLDKKMIAYITNAQGGVDEIKGSDAFIQRLEAMDIPSTNLAMNVTQVLPIESDKIMYMVEVNVHTDKAFLHNFSGQLIQIKRNKIIKYWMVEAQPEHSDQFWLHQDKAA